MTKKVKRFTQAPLPFQGQKRRFLKQFEGIVQTLPDDAVFVDLFGGSGLLSHTVKRIKPEATVVYNDYDNFSERLHRVNETNLLLNLIRKRLEACERNKKVPAVVRLQIIEDIEAHEAKYGFVDYISVSSSILFSGKYATNIDELKKHTFYNVIRASDYVVDSYLDGVIIVSDDYRAIFEKYKNTPGVIFFVDPPYLSTDVTSYKNYWKLSDYLNVLDVLNGTRYFYFTSNKSSIIELCEWMETRSSDLSVNPFYGSTTLTVAGSVNYNAKYDDIMLYKID
jgi:site-specific DNA-adenine methylase